MILIYLAIAIRLKPGGSSAVHIYTQTIHRTTQLTTFVERLSGIQTQNLQTNWEVCGPCPIFANYTLEFALQVRKKHGKTSVKLVEKCQLAKEECQLASENCALSLKLMYRHFNKPHIPMLYAVLFSLFQYASTVVTYMIVLMQFDQSEHSQNACIRNVTN